MSRNSANDYPRWGTTYNERKAMRDQVARDRRQEALTEYAADQAMMTGDEDD